MAGIKVRGDTAQLIKIGAKAAFLATPEPYEKISKVASEASLTLLRQEFASSTDPYGNAWLPLKYRKGQPLLDTGRLRNSFSAVNVQAGSFGIESTTVYAGVHQYGAIINRSAQVNAHSKSGRFTSRAKAGKRMRGAVRISITPAGQIIIPRRQMLPDDGNWGLWGPVLEKEADDYLRKALAL